MPCSCEAIDSTKRPHIESIICFFYRVTFTPTKFDTRLSHHDQYSPFAVYLTYQVSGILSAGTIASVISNRKRDAATAAALANASLNGPLSISLKPIAGGADGAGEHAPIDQSAVQHREQSHPHLFTQAQDKQSAGGDVLFANSVQGIELDTEAGGQTIDGHIPCKEERGQTQENDGVVNMETTTNENEASLAVEGFARGQAFGNGEGMLEQVTATAQPVDTRIDTEIGAQEEGRESLIENFGQPGLPSRVGEAELEVQERKPISQLEQLPTKLGGVPSREDTTAGSSFNDGI